MRIIPGFLLAIPKEIIITLIIILVVGGVLAFIFWPRKKAITVIRDSTDEIIYAIFQFGSSFLVKNMINKKFEPVQFKNWHDVVSYIERERSSWR